MRNQRGITLIALVITIIVLLILAGVSIAMLTGDNGILSNARTAQTQTVTKSNEEVLKLAVSNVITNHYANTVNNTTTSLAISKADLEAAIKATSSDYTVVSTTPAKNGEVFVQDVTGTLNVTFYGDSTTYKVNPSTGAISK